MNAPRFSAQPFLKRESPVPLKGSGLSIGFRPFRSKSGF